MNWKIVTCEVALIASCVLLIFKDLECWLVWVILAVAMILPCVALGYDIYKQRQKIKQENERIKLQNELDEKLAKVNGANKLSKDFCEWMEWKKAQGLSIGEINEEFKQFKKLFHSDVDKTE